MALTMTRLTDNIVIADYDPAWPRMFEEERARLQSAIGLWTVAIEHVGSTSVPDLAGKPVIDIGVALEDLADALKCITPLLELGYQCCGEFRIPGRIFFRKIVEDPIPGQITDGVGRTHQIHMYQGDHEQFVWHEYAALKRDVASRHGDDIEKYIEGKHAFIREILRRARMTEAVS